MGTTRAQVKGRVTVPRRSPISLDTYRTHRPPMAHDRRVDWAAAEQAWQCGVRRALALTLIALLLTMLLVDLLPLVLVSG